MPLYLAVVLPAMRLVTQPALACSMRGAFDEPFAGFDGCFRRDGHVDMVGPVDDDLAVFCRDGARLVRRPGCSRLRLAAVPAYRWSP